MYNEGVIGTDGYQPKSLLPFVHSDYTIVGHVLYFLASLVIRPGGLRPHQQVYHVWIWALDLSCASSVLSSFPMSWYLNMMVK